jgi:hypothetical protein
MQIPILAFDRAGTGWMDDLPPPPDSPPFMQGQLDLS